MENLKDTQFKVAVEIATETIDQYCRDWRQCWVDACRLAAGDDEEFEALLLRQDEASILV